MRLLVALGVFWSAFAFASATRIEQADSFISSDRTKSWALPAASDTLAGLAATQALTNKTISGSSNTLTNVGDASLSVPYLKADGTRALTGNWAAGAFAATFNSVQVGSAASTISGLSTIINGAATITLPVTSTTLIGATSTDTLQNKTISGANNTLSNVPVSVQMVQDKFFGNGTTTAFTLSFAPPASAGLQVFLDGTLMTLTTDYSVSSTTLTLVTAPATGQRVLVVYSKF